MFKGKKGCRVCRNAHNYGYFYRKFRFTNIVTIILAQNLEFLTIIEELLEWPMDMAEESIRSSEPTDITDGESIIRAKYDKFEVSSSHHALRINFCKFQNSRTEMFVLPPVAELNGKARDAIACRAQQYLISCRTRAHFDDMYFSEGSAR